MTGSIPRSALVRRWALCSLLPALLGAAPGPAEEAEKLREIADNSFLIEEAYNQEDGVVHNASTFMRDRATGDWVGTFTQEWPVVNEDHQLSYTVVIARATAATRRTGLGDALLNYRYQLLSDEAGIALAPRISAVLPTGDASRALGAGGYGLQLNLPASAQVTRWLVSHTNVGATWVPEGRAGGVSLSSRGYALGEGLVVRVGPRLNLLVEALWTRTDVTVGGVTSRTQELVVSPGFRTAFDFASGLQVVTGLGLPIGVGRSAGSLAILAYLSFELPFNEAGLRNAPGGPVRPPQAPRPRQDGP